ncbi:MAG: hypothetical protein HQK63_06095 [Desulfamplus sp.]|nr:hypothetical protein [Desulfamplus sp.]
MRIGQATNIGAWVLISLNLLMAFGSIWIFMRMSPAIKEIIEQNEHSLQACEEMLASLSMMIKANDGGGNNKIALQQANKVLLVKFEDALKRATNNITEKEEPHAIELIKTQFKLAFDGDFKAKEETVAAIILLGKINREAMIKADIRARQFGQAGAWGVVFMSTTIFFSGMLFKRNLLHNLIRPIEEIDSVISAHRNGDNMRRCSGADLPADFVSIFHGINEILDQCQSEFSIRQK